MRVVLDRHSAAPRIALVIVSIALAAILVAPPARANIIDGGFESGVLAGPFGSPLPPSFGQWTRSTVRSNLVSPPSPVHSGAYGLEVDTRTATAGSFVYQDFDSGTLSYAWTFWMYPADGTNVAEVVYNWDRGTGFAETGTAIVFRPDDTQIFAWDANATLAPLAAGAWHEVRVTANRCTLVQEMTVDGVPWGRVQATGSAPAGIATVILGDVKGPGYRAQYYYDDVAFGLFDCEQQQTVCPRSQGYWKNHPAAWPVDRLTLGKEAYDQPALHGILRMPTRGDASLILAKQLIAAKLNVANGSDPAPVAVELADADAVLGAYAGRIPLGVRTSTPAGAQMTALAAVLDAYNNGELTPGCGRLESGGSSPPALPPRRGGFWPR